MENQLPSIKKQITKPKRDYKMFLSYFVAGITIVISISIIGLIWYESTRKTTLNSEYDKVYKGLLEFDEKKLDNAELTIRLDAISSVLNRDQNSSAILEYTISQLGLPTSSIDSISRSFSGLIEIKYSTNSIKTGTDLYNKISLLQNFSNLRLVSMLESGSDKGYLFTITFNYLDGLSTN